MYDPGRLGPAERMAYQNGVVAGRLQLQTENDNLRAEIERLRILLREASQYVADAGSDEDPETVTHSSALLTKIEALGIM